MPYKSIVYKCIDCGNPVITKNRNGTNVCRSCNAIRNCKSIKDMGIKGNILRPFEYAYNSLLRAARQTNRVVTVSYEDYLEFTKVLNCHYCDRNIPWSQYTDSKKKNNNYYLDRKNNFIGYEKHNLVVCCPKCNRIKSNEFSYVEFLKIIRFIKTIRASY